MPYIVTPLQAEEIKKSLIIDKAWARRRTNDYYIRYILVKHFSRGNLEAYQYQDVTKKYKQWKIKNGYGDVLLVLTGALKKAVLQGRVRGVNQYSEKLVFDIPEYGLYQLKVRPFLDPSQKDLDALSKYFKRVLKARRRETVSRILGYPV